DVNNHIHTTYSFSPYSPTKSVWMARQAGLATAGIMDHDSIGGAREFIEAGRIANLPVTIGAEIRVSLIGTPYEGRHVSNPDQLNAIYVALHGIPHNRIDAVEEFLKPIREKRFLRGRAMSERLNAMLAPAALGLDFVTDVVPLSQWHDGGEITERHILYAVAEKLLAKFGAGGTVVPFLKETLGMELSPKIEAMLTDPANPHIAYDLLGAMKGTLVEKFFIPATDECPSIRDTAEFCAANNIILAYAYLGDVTDSVTGDKRAQKHEDAILDELFGFFAESGFNAITYMPSRNTRAQLERVSALCDKLGFFQISGEDINQPRQKFVCEAMRDPYFAKLHDAAWALIGHEKAATANPDDGMFSRKTLERMPGLEERVAHYRDLAAKDF
ncbi:MAG: PHP domain-containing protein, partial [Kiritimatiellaeota bacterium]|nr:PHP domain-containing protein [Kiritimatiellota bacterium]